MLTSEQIVENYSNLIENIKSSTESYVSSPLLDLLSKIEDRLAVAPIGLKRDELGAYPGALVEEMISLREQISTFDDVRSESIVLTASVYGLCRMGDLTHDLYLQETDSWRRDKLGSHYKFSEEISRMSPTHRTLWLLQDAGAPLTQDEWLTIQTSSGLHLPENSFYAGYESSLTTLFHVARQIVVCDSRKSLSSSIYHL